MTDGPLSYNFDPASCLMLLASTARTSVLSGGMLSQNRSRQPANEAHFPSPDLGKQI